MDGEREKFEAWYETCGHTYGEHYIVNFAFKAWQARASLPSAQPSGAFTQPQISVEELLYRYAQPGDMVEYGEDNYGNPTLKNAPEKLRQYQAALTTQQAQSGDVQQSPFCHKCGGENVTQSYAAALSKIKQLESETNNLVEAASDVITCVGTKCWFDHSGNCQEHFISNPCPVRILQDAIAPFTQNKGD